MKDYKEIFDSAVEQLDSYITTNNLKSIVLGISGGIDSSVCAVICNEVAKLTGVTFLGRSLTIKNKFEEYNTARSIGLLCDDFREVNLNLEYNTVRNSIIENEDGISTAVADGNIQARIRMIYLYHLANVNQGIVIDTDNLTERYLGFYTIHGDQGDYKPIGSLWKTEVYELANWMYNNLQFKLEIEKAFKASIEMKPTDGLGISDSDLEQIGANSYAEVDTVLKLLLKNRNKDIDSDVVFNGIPKEVVDNIIYRYESTHFKRKSIPSTLLL